MRRLCAKPQNPLSAGSGRRRPCKKDSAAAASGSFSRRVLMLLVLGCMAVGPGCASGKLSLARQEFYRGDPQQAARVLENPGGVAGRSRLLYFMEKGLILFEAGEYEQSIDALLKATALISEQQTISVSRQGGSLVTSERITVYRGEYAERLLVHTYLMMNFLLVRKVDDALVEAKQAMEVIDAHREACRRDYFSRALVAHCFEAAGEINGAYIEYKKLAGDMADPLPVAAPLYRLAVRLGFAEEAQTYAKQLMQAGRDLPQGPPEAELIVFAAQGAGPVKIPGNIVLPPSIRFSFVSYRKRSGFLAEPALGGGGLAHQARITTDTAEVLERSLRERAARVFAKETARVAAKESIAANIEDPVAELLARLAFFITEEPDTRGWETLPARLTMIRTPLPPGTHRLWVQDSRGKRIGLPAITVRAGSPRRYYYHAVRFGLGD